MARPMTVSIRFNGDTELTITPYEGKDKELLGHAVRGNTVRAISIAPDGSVKITLIEKDKDGHSTPDPDVLAVK